MKKRITFELIGDDLGTDNYLRDILENHHGDLISVKVCRGPRRDYLTRQKNAVLRAAVVFADTRTHIAKLVDAVRALEVAQRKVKS